MTQEDIIRMARDCGINFHQAGWPELERFAALVAAAERWAILELVDSYAKNNTDLADAIRARGQA
jgi:hypothetical protein